MKSLFVAWQDPETREWIPVAQLSRNGDQYNLSYTRGATRCQGFRGLGRMNSMDATYVSNQLFPFFKNRLLQKSRPEYQKILEWLDIKNINEDPMDILIGTGGLRSTDSFELIPQPTISNRQLSLNFFARGLRHLPESTIDQISRLKNGSKLFLMKDFQNENDHKAFALRTDEKPLMMGYVPKYFCTGIHELIKRERVPLITLLKVNNDAPLDMRCLCNAFAEIPDNFKMIDDAEDFLPWNQDSFDSSVNVALRNSNLDLD